MTMTIPSAAYEMGATGPVHVNPKGESRRLGLKLGMPMIGLKRQGYLPVAILVQQEDWKNMTRTNGWVVQTQGTAHLHNISSNRGINA
ncbi:MAG TPA: hypothetical protein DEW46_05045 [Verrucomicrobia bacterium]|jgi:hypothetical protein|nr:hypothetical protein [Verrucomicrobiota bacterium]